MVITEQQKQTIELLNPWHVGKTINLGIKRTNYLEKVSRIIENRKQILFLFGSRRVGKTMILFQYINQLIKEGINPKKILFLSLDNTNLQKIDLFSFLSQSDYLYIILDEVHFFSTWAQTLKSLYDLPAFKAKILASGSSSKLIEDNKAFLTGRSVSITVCPLSYTEFLQFNSSDNQIEDYLFYGGYPEHVLEKQSNYLNEVVRDIVEKDIVKLYNIKNSQYLFYICQILAKQIGYKGSANKISKVLGLDNKTVVNYIEYLREVKLIETVFQYSESINERLYAPKKYYFNDLGMRNSFTGFTDKGALVENAIFIKLVELFGVENISYYADTSLNEVDFVVKIQGDKLMLVESKYINLSESVVNSLSKALTREFYGKVIAKRVVITDGVNSTEKMSGVLVHLISLEKFLLSTPNLEARNPKLQFSV